MAYQRETQKRNYNQGYYEDEFYPQKNTTRRQYQDQENYVHIQHKKSQTGVQRDQVLHNYNKQHNNNYQQNQKGNNEDAFLENPYYNRNAFDYQSSMNIVTFQEDYEQQQLLEEEAMKQQEIMKQQQLKQQQQCQEIEKNSNQYQDPTYQYYNRDLSERYQEIKNYYQNRYQSQQSILTPKSYGNSFEQSKFQKNQQNNQISQLENQNRQQQQKPIQQNSDQQLNQYQNQLPQQQNNLVENQSFGMFQQQQPQIQKQNTYLQLQNQAQKQSQQQNQNLGQQKQFAQTSEQSYQQQQLYQSQNSQNYQGNKIQGKYEIYDSAPKAQQYNKQQSQQNCGEVSQFQNITAEKQREYQQRLQNLEQLKGRLPKDQIISYQPDDRQYAYQQQVINSQPQFKSNPIKQQNAISRVESQGINQQRLQDYQSPIRQQQYQQQYGNQYQQSVKQQNQYQRNYDHNQQYQHSKQIRTPNRYRDDSYERERQQFFQQSQQNNQRTRNYQQNRI